MGWFALSVGPKTPDNGCAWFDQIYFAAFTAPQIELALDPVPESYWQTECPLNMKLGRRIEKHAELPEFGIVEHPLILSVHQRPSGRADQLPIVEGQDDEETQTPPTADQAG